MGRELILQFSGYYELNDDSVYKILVEYESAQTLKRTIIKSRKIIEDIVNEKYKTKLLKYENNLKIYGIGKALSYIDDFISLRNILMLNKKFNMLLKAKVYMNALSHPNVSLQMRSSIWRIALVKESLIEKYEFIKSTKLQSYMSTIIPQEELINLDVIRSFHRYDDKIQDVLYN